MKLILPKPTEMDPRTNRVADWCMGEPVPYIGSSVPAINRLILDLIDALHNGVFNVLV